MPVPIRLATRVSRPTFARGSLRTSSRERERRVERELKRVVSGPAVDVPQVLRRRPAWPAS